MDYEDGGKRVGLWIDGSMHQWVVGQIKGEMERETDGWLGGCRIDGWVDR